MPPPSKRPEISVRARPVSNLVFEACERRLVLSAQLLFDVLGDHALEMHSASPVSDSRPDAPPLESHLREAHAATGWNEVQQRFGLTGRGQTVAVIDSGVAWDHVALGNGYGAGYRVVGGWDFAENDANPYDDGPFGFHGTHVSGIIASDHLHHSGVAPEVDMVALRVFNDMGQGQLSWVERALQWVHDNRTAFEHPITTVNLSLGTAWNADAIPSWATLEEELQALYDDGVVVVASAGNSFQEYLTPGLSYPAASQYVLPVASVDDDGRLSDFSQRNGRVLAAPGSNIVSSVPDHVLGRDGKIDDFIAASGTSMAAPYISGASILVRQAMEMAGLSGINADSIAQHLRNTADSIFDSLTSTSYDRVNLESAIDSVIPADTVGDSLQTSAEIGLTQAGVSGWVNHIGDTDVFRFTASNSGTLHLHARSDWLDELQWSLDTGPTRIESGFQQPTSLQLVAGTTYHLQVSGGRSIGPYELELQFAADANSGTPPPTASAQDLGTVRYLERSATGGEHFRVQAAQDGTFSVQWSDSVQAGSSLGVWTGGQHLTDGSWQDGKLRIDTQVVAGQWLDVRLPTGVQGAGELAIANVLTSENGNLQLTGTMLADDIGLYLQDGLKVRFGTIEYAFAEGEIDSLRIDGQGSNDRLTITGSSRADKVELRPTGSTVENEHLTIDIHATEEIAYFGGGGPDRVYLYDSDTDDTLTARPGRAELVGVGYRFEVADVSRIYVHATGGGQDHAYLYDSDGEDRLSVRPQFSSMTGPGYFNYVRGFERVYAYANSGGVDIAYLYDSDGADRFITSGASASIVGPGFSSYTRSFEQVYAVAESGGADWATLYATGSNARWNTGSDFVSFQEADWNREARGFRHVDAFVAGQQQSLPLVLGAADHATGGIGADFAAVPVAITAPEANAASSSMVGAQVHLTAAAGFAETAGALPQRWQATDWLSLDDEFRSQAIAAEQQSAGNEAMIAAEAAALDEWREAASWLRNSLVLPEAPLLEDPALEFSILDEIFGAHS